MPYNYVESFRTELEQKYSRELTSAALTTANAIFIGAKIIKIPRLDLDGYKDHSRNGGWNRQSIQNSFEPKELAFDRDVEFYVDAMDVDETNQILSAANTTAVFETEQAIPELDKYRYSKLYADYVALGKSVDTTAPTLENVLGIYDNLMEKMDEAEVPQEGRKLYATPQICKLLKQAEELRKVVVVTNNSGAVNQIGRAHV